MGLPIPVVSEETRLKMSQKSKGRRHSKETKEKISVTLSKVLEEKGGGGWFRNIKSYSVKNITGEEFKTRGTWELRFAEYLNSKNVLWIRKKYLKYIDDGIERTYAPDFYLPMFDKYVEIKGFFPDKEKRKMEMVREQNDVKIVMGYKKDIDDMDVFWEKILVF